MIDGPFAKLVAAGAYLSIVPLGAWLARAAVPTIADAPLRERLAGALALGIGAWSILYIPFIFSGDFSPRLNGVVGWAILAAIGMRGILRNASPRRAVRMRIIRARNIVAIAAVLSLGFLYFGFPDESLLGTRDEGIYTLAALALERGGSLALKIPGFVAAAPELFPPFVDGEPFYVPGVYETPAGLVVQFSPLLPAWIAQAHATFGDVALYRTSALMALAAVIVFHALVRRMLLPGIAAACTAVFALNPATIWIARVNLSEPLMLLLVLGGLRLGQNALAPSGRHAAIAASMLFAIAAFLRLDAVLIAPLLMAAAAMSMLNRRSPSRVPEQCVPLAVLTIGAQSVAVALLALASGPYVRSNEDVLWAALVATAIAAAATAALRTRNAPIVLGERPARIVAWTCALLLAGLFVYAAVWRPYHGPFATIVRPGHVSDGQRDWRERSLVNLAAYLEWPTLVLALVGAVWLVFRMLRGRAKPSSTMLWMIAVPTAIVMLANPRVSPDHFWAIRRFVPIVVPGTIVLAGCGLQTLLFRCRRSWFRFLAAGVTALVVVSLLVEQRETLLRRENRGLTPQIRSLAALTSHADIVVVRDLDPIAATLFLGFGQPVAALRAAQAVPDAQARVLWSRCTPDAPCTLVHRDRGGLSGLALGESQTVDIVRDYIAFTLSPLPQAMTHEATRVLVTPVVGLAPSPPSR